MVDRRSFHDLHAHGFVRVAVATPEVALADPATNAERTVEHWRRATADGAAIVLFPELGLSGYSLDDLHQQDALLDAVRCALHTVAEATRGVAGLLVVGAPLRVDGRLFNTAVVLGDGEVHGVVPKSYLPNYREFYEKRQFAAARDGISESITLLDQEVPFGNDLLFQAADHPDLVLHVEVCEDVWVPVPPSTWAALGGATVLANLSASNITVGKADYRRELAGHWSAKTIAAYLYASCGAGESTTDLAWDGYGVVYENGSLLAESERFAPHGALVLADVDLDRLVQDRSRMSSFVDCATDHAERIAALRLVDVGEVLPTETHVLRRAVERFPYVPADGPAREARCAEAYHIQVAGLSQRLSSSGIEKAVIGVSGGLDSTHALIVTCRAMDALGLPRENVLAYTMPAYATSSRTLENAQRLMAALGVTGRTIDITPACDLMPEQLDHPAAKGEAHYDVTYENVQAGERTNHLFRLANRHGGLVVGTGDLSELALGWCTYGVGDHMSHYNPNASVPKTLIRHLIAWEARRGEVGDDAAEALAAILDTEISPELVPGDGDEPAQKTEEIVGPYELHDFCLYHVTRRGYRPSKVAYLATRAWAGDVPDASADAPYDTEQVVHWLSVFLDRFFRTSQFKRSAVPNGPKVGSGGSLSPRGDWRAPSDGGAAPWLADLEATRRWIEASR